METNAGSARLGSLRESGLELRGASRPARFLRVLSSLLLGAFRADRVI